MNDERPWGITVTRTMHLPDWHGGHLHPRCGDDRVRAAIEHQLEVNRSTTSPADKRAPLASFPKPGQKVCRSCMRSARRTIAYLEDEIERAEAHNPTIEGAG